MSQEEVGKTTGVEDTESGFADYQTPLPILYRKKPVLVEAIGFGVVDDATTLIDWIAEHDGTARFVGEGEDHGLRRQDEYNESEGTLLEDAPAFLVIDTLEGSHRADLGDYIIKGVKNEFYPCKPDIFTATYDKE